MQSAYALSVDGKAWTATGGTEHSRLVVGVTDHDSVKAALIRLREAHGKAPEEKG